METRKMAINSTRTAGFEGLVDGYHNIIISGGTGTGRVSSILSFTAFTGEYVIWLSLGSGSLHTEKFWRAFSKTLKRWSGIFVENLEQPGMPVEIKEIGRLIVLINQAAARTGKAILVIDGWQLLAEGPVKNLFENIRVSCCAGVSAVFISNEHVEISSQSGFLTPRRTDQIIALTREEIRVYYTALNIVMDDKTLDEFFAVTAGWVQAVLRISRYLPRAEAIRQEHIDQAINLLYQYFHDESHSSLKPELRQNLILLSMLQSFTLEMVLELTSLTAEDCMKLYQEHFFCYSSALNETCFHRLYQNYLAGMQNEVPKKTRFAFLRRAAVWYDRCDRVIEAVSCYVRCNEYDLIIPVLKKRSIPGLRPDQAAQIVKSLETIPQSYMDRHPLHRLYLILVRYYKGDREPALLMQRELYAELEAGRRSTVEDRVLGELHVSEAFQAWSDLSVEYYRHMRAASELLPEGSAFLDVDEHCSPIGSVLQFHSLQPGDLLQAKEICLRSAPYTSKVLPNIGSSACYLSVAEVHLYRCEYNDAIEYANLAASEAVRTRTWGIVAESCYVLQRIHMAIGELDDILAYGRQIVEYYNFVSHTAIYSIERITNFHENVYFGLYHLLDSFADANPLINQDNVNHINIGRELYVHAIYKVFALRQYNPALTFIDKACQVSHSTGMFFTRLKLLILKALVCAKMEKPAAAARSLLEAYRISQSNYILFSFLEFGEEMQYLLHAVEPHVNEQDLPKAWRKRVLQESEQYQQQRTFNTLEYLRRNRHVRPGRLDQLTKQEYNALKYAAMGKSTEEAAQIMRVNPSTIYLYLSRAYRKMEVERREQAVQIAIAEGILH